MSRVSIVDCSANIHSFLMNLRDIEGHSPKVFASVFKTTTWRICFFTIHWFISMNIRDIEALHSTNFVCMGLDTTTWRICFFTIHTMILFYDLERHRGTLNKNLLHGYNHFANLLFYNTMNLLNELERYRGSLSNMLWLNHSANLLFFTK